MSLRLLTRRSSAALSVQGGRSVHPVIAGGHLGKEASLCRQGSLVTARDVQTEETEAGRQTP